MILTAKCLDMQLFFSGSGSCHFHLKNELFSGKYYFSWCFYTNFASCVSPLILWTCASAPAGNSRKIIIHHHAASTGETKKVRASLNALKISPVKIQAYFIRQAIIITHILLFLKLIPGHQILGILSQAPQKC